MRTLIKNVLAAAEPKDNITVQGWVRTRRDSKGFSFLEVNDGSCLANLQIVVDAGIPGSEHLAELTTGASTIVTGNLVKSPAAGQSWEMRATRVELVGKGRPNLPVAKKKGHTQEYSCARSPICGPARTCLARQRCSWLRSRLAFAVHQFFQERDFVYVHTPVITGSDCEGAGEMFRVTTLKGNLDEKPGSDFFGKPTYLTVSGQLGRGSLRLRALQDLRRLVPPFGRRTRTLHATPRSSG